MEKVIKLNYFINLQYFYIKFIRLILLEKVLKFLKI